MTKRGRCILFDLRIYHYMMQQRGWKSLDDIVSYLELPKGVSCDAIHKRIRRCMQAMTVLNLVAEDRDRGEIKGRGAAKLYWRKIF